MIRFSVENVTSKLQVLRAAHALTEAGGTLCVDESLSPILTYLSARLPLSWEVGDAPMVPLDVDHATPRTALGTMTRSLLFPHSAVDWCHAGWAERSYRFTFAGLMTADRLETLDGWSRRSGGGTLRSPSSVVGRLFPNAPLKGSPRGTKVWDTSRGRTYPEKAWDEGYFGTLGRSQFVLCPSGDFVWTYRVFEAALCGAIPVAEAECEAYGDLILYSLDDDPTTLQWDPEIARHNQKETARLVTAPTEELHQALESAVR